VVTGDKGGSDVFTYSGGNKKTLITLCVKQKASNQRFTDYKYTL